MTLHNDKDSFRFLLETVHEQTGYRTDVLEKDYYVLLILHELAGFQADGLPAFFKEGRFSLKQKVNDTPRKQPKVPQPKKEDEH